MHYISKRHLVTLIVLVVIVGGLLLAGEKLSRQLSTETSMVPSAQISREKEPLVFGVGEPQEQMESKSFIIRPGQSRLTYTEALDLYKNDVLQFGQDCQLTTASRSFHLNNEIMIDNRSSKPNTFSVGSALVAIGPYDFAFMILKDKGNISVQCGAQKQVAVINVQ